MVEWFLELKEADIDVTEKWIVSNAHAAKPELRQGALMAAMVVSMIQCNPSPLVRLFVLGESTLPSRSR